MVLARRRGGYSLARPWAVAGAVPGRFQGSAVVAAQIGVHVGLFDLFFAHVLADLGILGDRLGAQADTHDGRWDRLAEAQPVGPP